MNTAPAPPAAATPAPVAHNLLVIKNLTPEQVQRILNGDDSPEEVGGVRCLKVAFLRCSPALQAEKAAHALADAPPEVKAAGRAEIVAMLRAAAPTIGQAVLARIITKLGLPDEPIPYSEEHAQQARELIAQALADCAVCIVDAVEFFEKFVADVYKLTDSRGRLAYRLVIRVGGDEEFKVTLLPSEFRGRGKSKKLKVPEALNDLLRAQFGIEVDARTAGDLLALIETNAKPETLYEEIMLRTALRQLLRLPRLKPLSYHGTWCKDGFLFIPTHLAAEVADALAHQLGNKFAFVKLCRKFRLLAEPYYKSYTPRDFSCRTENCARAYVFDVSRVAEFLSLPPEAICEPEA